MSAFYSRLPGFVRGILLAAGALVGMTFLAVVALVVISNARLNQTYTMPDPEISLPGDEGSLARGEHLVRVLAGCTDCHGEDLAGDLLYDDALFGQIVASNLTSGLGGVGADYQVDEWVRAIRHGVGPDNRSLIFVMSSYYNHLSDEDLGAIIAYLRTLQPVDNPLPPTRMGLLSRVFILLDPNLLPAQVIDHWGSRKPPPEPGVTVEYGEYLAVACTICHGPNFSGGLSVGAGLNLTPGGDLASWTLRDFRRALRAGMTPEFVSLDPDIMPWERLGKLTDEEIEAIWLYLQSLPALQTADNPS
jgi:mono/diheme cytochrome c family protein